MIDPTLRIPVARLFVTPIESMSPAPELPIDADTLRSHCNALIANDTLLELYQRAAIQWLENDLGKTIVARPHRWVIGDFPRSGDFSLQLPGGKTISVEKIEYVTSGETATLYGPSSDLSPDAEDFQEDLTSDNGGILKPAQSGSWPTPDSDAGSPVAIMYTAGFEEGSVPADIQEAILFAVSTLFEHRGAADLVTGGKVDENVFGVMSFLLQTRREHPFA